MNPMYQLGQDLALLLTLQGEKKRKIFTLEREKEKLEFDLTPKTGWEGKNESDRTIMRQLTFSNNGPWIANKLQLEEARAEQISVETDIASLQAEQDSFKWLIRNETNVIMGGRDWLDEAMLAAQDASVEDLFDFEKPTPTMEEMEQAAGEQIGDMLKQEEVSPDDLPF